MSIHDRRHLAAGLASTVGLYFIYVLLTHVSPESDLLTRLRSAASELRAPGYWHILLFSNSTAVIWLLVNYIVFVASACIALLLHESGHALAARLLDFKIFGVAIGMGPTLWEREVRGTVLQLNAAPISGAVACASTNQRWLRARLWILYAAGPAANLFAAVMFDQLLSVDASQALFPLLLWNWLMLFNLIPVDVSTPLGKLKSDGWMILAAPFLSKQACDDHISAYYALEAGLCLRRSEYEAAKRWHQEGLRKNPRNALLLHDFAAVLLQTGEYEAARKQLLSLLENPNLKQPIRAFASNNLAWADVCLDKPELLDEADRHSGEALRAFGQMPPFRGTRGAVLIKLGQLNFGMKFCLEAFRRNRQAHSRALNACWLAFGESLRGNTQQAAQWAERAQNLDPNCLLLPWAMKQVHGSRLASATG